VIVFYSPRYQIDIGMHVFPTIKYVRLFERLRADNRFRFMEPSPANWNDLALVHSAAYLEKLQTGNMSYEDIALLELPWSPDVVEGFRLMTGGTIEAARTAMERRDGDVVGHLGGGLHHAFPNHGEGFCVFNDVAVAIHVLRRDGIAHRAAVVDLDVHHGNGTAFIFERDEQVFTFSMHQQYNYPAHKPRGSLDIGLADGTNDEEYLTALTRGLEQVVLHEPDIVFYLAGADPYEDDQLGGLLLTKSGLRERDAMVLRMCRNQHYPTVVTLAGGYARRLDDTVDVHYQTVMTAADLV
jgi:acetoin utilization deacetylase AcuC-like enzyme